MGLNFTVVRSGTGIPVACSGRCSAAYSLLSGQDCCVQTLGHGQLSFVGGALQKKI